ncbi:tetratricopeptide repeat-containing sulfotransferase family protein [Dasania marina]|uniref:tetratricopeptide repeat-containing sulfotransferase family protein n=1 Tax=Dasania marina TaxID=471499 RepID=UPI00035D0841|nr:tetratricopeptide repeat-containing sulfotransferase family protein [Dasania marina]
MSTATNNTDAPTLDKLIESEPALPASAQKHPELITAAEHLLQSELFKAETLIREVLKKDPGDVSAIRMLADLGTRLNRFDDAKLLLERCLQLAPDFHLARQNYASVLMRSQKLEQALTEAETLLAIEPNNANYLLLKATILVRMGEHLAALPIYEQVFKQYPHQAKAQLSYGHILKTLGRVDEAVAAYRKVITLRPALGEVYWSLANLKTFRFTDDDIATMREQVTEEGGNAEDQSHLAFALGKALEDKKDFNESFKFYQRGNNIRSIGHPYSPEKNMHNAVRQIHSCTQPFFEQRKGLGCSAKDPIFIVGLPRAGSTLLEQILASHSQVEGTAELPDIIAMARRLAGKLKNKPAGLYPEVLAELAPEQFKALGESYLKSTQIQRNDTLYFIDKMPNNFMHIGLIHLILPNAKIIDARRHPMAGCFASYKQLFAQGQTFTYKLEDLGHYYRNYVNVMDHWEKVLPGRVLRVQYEDMVADSETQIRRLLAYCGLPFEEQCLRFYETDRAIRTPSSEQVRQPIFKEGLEQWRNYEAHLQPLKQALGPMLERYPI